MKKKLLSKRPASIGMVFSAALVCGLWVLSGCQKDSMPTSSTSQWVDIHINDNPVSDLTNVWIDIQVVEVKIDTGEAKHHMHDDNYYAGDKHDDDDKKKRDEFGVWDTLQITPGVYDLLKFRNGLDTLLAQGNVKAGRIHKVRMTLGSNNAVSKDSGVTKIPLSICSGKPYVYVMLQKHHMQEHGVDRSKVQLDFDLASSISYDGKDYCLKPVVHAFNDKESGRIEGRLFPKDVVALPMAFSLSDTFYAKPTKEGEFKICGIKPGTYSVKFNPVNGYQDSVIQNGCPVTLPPSASWWRPPARRPAACSAISAKSRTFRSP